MCLDFHVERGPVEANKNLSGHARLYKYKHAYKLRARGAHAANTTCASHCAIPKMIREVADLSSLDHAA